MKEQTLIPVPDYQDLIVIRCELDMTVPLFHDCVQGSHLIFPSVPIPLVVSPIQVSCRLFVKRTKKRRHTNTL